MSHSLVIGGTLFIGRALVRRLLARGDQIVILHRGASTPFGDRVQQIRCDRNDVTAMQSALSGRSFDLVFDNVYDWQRGTTAEQVSAAALASAAGLRCYVFTSSIGAYGAGLNHEEDDPLAPATHPMDYIRNKAESERTLFRLHRERGLPAVTLRPAFVYGPENPFYREAFFWDRLLADRPIIIPDDGSNLMQFVHVEDVARAAVVASETAAAAGRAYNLSNWPPLTQVEYVEALARAAGKRAELVYVPRERIQAAGGQVFEPPYYFGEYYDLPSLTQKTDRVRTELGLDLTPLDAGLQATFAWYRSQSNRPEPDFSWENALLAGRR